MALTSVAVTSYHLLAISLAKRNWFWLVQVRKGEAHFAAHGLRRTAAALALKGGTRLRQFQQMLGQASITTTEWYLEPMRSLQVTAGDFIQIELALTR